MYTGQMVPIPLGQLGLRTDDPVTSLPPNAAIRANNISFQSSRIEKSKGSAQYNTASFSSAVVAVFDWFPTPSEQRMIALTADGKCWRDTGSGSFNTNTPIATGLGTLTPDAHMVAGGAESANRDRKLFVFTGTSQIKVLQGDGAALTSIDLPSADWASGNFPTYGLIWQNRLVVIGSSANRHTAYFSTIEDHENFQGTVAVPFLLNVEWDIWHIGSPNSDQSATLQSGGAVTILPAVNNEGFLLQGSRKFDKVTMTISQAQTGSPVYTYSYWNGSSWQALTLTSTPSYTAVGTTTLQFAIPTDWNVGDGGITGADATRYSIRVLATTAPVTSVRSTGFQVESTTIDVFPPIFNIFPGESDGVVSAGVYKGRLFFFKQPYGIYYIETNGSADYTNWSVERLTDTFGIGSPHGHTQVLDDLLAANSQGGINSLQATQAFGDLKAGDVLANAQVEEFIKSITDPAGIPVSHAIYYQEKKRAMFTMRSSGGLEQDKILVIDVAKQTPRIEFETKDQPTCLALRKDSSNILRPYYGANDGFIYLMERSTYDVAGEAYLGEFQTPYIDFSYLDQTMGGKVKLFDFLEVQFVATGNWSFLVDVYLDNQFSETLTVRQNVGSVLDQFVLDTDTLSQEFAQSVRLPLHGAGRRISFRIYNSTMAQYFKIERFVVNFRLSAEQQKPNSGTYKV